MVARLTLPDDKVFVDPKTFGVGDLTFINCNDSRGLFGWFIKWYTKGNYCHSMIMRKPGYVCTQNDFFQEIPIDKYLNDSEGLKFWRIKGLTSDEFNIIDNAITQDLEAPWYRKMYNYLGLIGQALHIPGISMPGQDICSQRNAKYLRLLPRLAAITPEIPSPSEEDKVFTNHPDLMTCIGYYWQD